MRIKNIEELESFSAYLGTVWFDRYQDLVSYILNEGKVSFGAGATDFLVNVFQPITHTPMLEKNSRIASLIAPHSNPKRRMVLFRLRILFRFASLTTGPMTNCIFE